MRDWGSKTCIIFHENGESCIGKSADFLEYISEKELEEDNKRLEMKILVLTRNYEVVLGLE